MADHMKEILTMMLNKVKVFNTCLMAHIILANLKKVSKKEEEFLSGLMDKFMMVNGLEARKMEAVCGKVQKATLIWENG